MASAQGPGRGDGRGAGLRVAVLFVGLCLAGAATVAVVASRDPKVLRLAVVGALWAFLLAALAVPRRRALRPAQPDVPAGRELELRRTYQMELEREVAARREYELQLEVYLRRELEQGLRQDVEALREEVGRLRSEVLDRLDGELRMERIETTRLIGGSLRALQDEARRLGISRRSVADDAGFSVDEPALAFGEGAARGVLPAGAAPESTGGSSLYESLQPPTGPAAGPEGGAGGVPSGDYGWPEPAAPTYGWPAYGGDEPGPPARPGYQVPMGDRSEPWPGDRMPEPAPPGYAGYETVPPSGEPFERVPERYESAPPPRRDEPWPEDPLARPPDARLRDAWLPDSYQPVPPPRGYEPVPGPTEPAARRPSVPRPGPVGPEPEDRGYFVPVTPSPSASPVSPAPEASSGPDVMPGSRRYERSPTHRAAESAPGSPASQPPGGRRRDRSRTSAGEPPGYSADDELSRIFAGRMEPQLTRDRPEPGRAERRRRYREDDEPNDVISRLLGRS
jgi:hypothetical protein